MCFKEMPDLDGKNVVIGKIVDGLHILHRIEINPVGAKDKPIKDVTIAQCGKTKKPWNMK